MDHNEEHFQSFEINSSVMECESIHTVGGVQENVTVPWNEANSISMAEDHPDDEESYYEIDEPEHDGSDECDELGDKVVEAENEDHHDNDTEMINVLRKQRAEISKEYAIRHFVYCLYEYRQDINIITREKEFVYMPNPLYMTNQPEITHCMRSILVDWMAEVVKEFRLQRETLFLAVNYLDRYLSLRSVTKDNLQLIGSTVLFIASKVEEVMAPAVDMYTVGYSTKDVCEMEFEILCCLDFKTIVPTANFFCLDLLNMLSLDELDYAMTLYILETTLLFGNEFIKYPPSLTAAASVLMSHFLFGKGDSHGFLRQIMSFTGYEFQHLSPCINTIFDVFQNNAMKKYTTIKNKYHSSRYHSVSDFVIPKDLSIRNFLNERLRI